MAKLPEYRSLSDWVVLNVIDEIKAGTIKPADRLIERDLAARYGVSRAPARDAIRKLQVLGVVTQEQHKGASVISWTDADALEVVLLVDALILLSVQLAVGKLTEADLKELDDLLHETRRLSGEGFQNIHQRMELELQFHIVIARAAQHKRLVQMLDQFRFGLELYAYLVMPQIPVSHSLQLHEELLDVLRRGDAEAAIRCVLEHQKESQQLFRSAVSSGRLSLGVEGSESTDFRS
jgi:DNA-binding GntR family transcriptional regulator